MSRVRLIVLAAVSLFVVACGGESEPEGDAPERVVGVITEIEPEDAHEPENFTVEEEDGDTFTIEVDPEHDYGFDLLHVYEHFNTEDPVEVTVEERDGGLVATEIADVE